MSEPIEVRASERSNYRPEPCRECGAKVRVQGWANVSTMADAEALYMPKRKCTNPQCSTNAGTLAAPLP